MPSSPTDEPELIRSRMIKAFSEAGFFIFSKHEHQFVSRILRQSNLHHVLRVNVLDPKRGLFIVEIDPRTYVMKCHDKCIVMDVLDQQCYIECKESSKLSMLKEVILRLSKENSSNSMTPRV